MLGAVIVLRMKSLSLAVVAAASVWATGCAADRHPRPDPEPAEQIEARQVTGDLQFFCQWNGYDDAFATAQADYASGNRRFADAWTVLSKTDAPYDDPHLQSFCWEGALLYLGVFGSRAEIPALLNFADKDVLIEDETTDLAQPGGMSDLGELRSDVHRRVYFALAAQVRRQLFFDGTLDTAGRQAAALLEDCALDHARCLPSTPMHIYRKQRHQRYAVRGLAISGSVSNWTAFQDLERRLASLHFLLPHAVAEAKQIRERIDASFLGCLPDP